MLSRKGKGFIWESSRPTSPLKKKWRGVVTYEPTRRTILCPHEHLSAEVAKECAVKRVRVLNGFDQPPTEGWV
jgi:hypothetical protein